MTIEEERSAFMKAYEWMLKVQRALLFKKFTVGVRSQFTPDNHTEENLHGWTAKLVVIDEECDNTIRVDWFPWYGDEQFLPEKARLEGYLLAKGIVIE